MFTTVINLAAWPSAEMFSRMRLVECNDREHDRIIVATIANTYKYRVDIPRGESETTNAIMKSGRKEKNGICKSLTKIDRRACTHGVSGKNISA